MYKSDRRRLTCIRPRPEDQQSTRCIELWGSISLWSNYQYYINVHQQAHEYSVKGDSPPRGNRRHNTGFDVGVWINGGPTCIPNKPRILKGRSSIEGPKISCCQGMYLVLEVEGFLSNIPWLGGSESLGSFRSGSWHWISPCEVCHRCRRYVEATLQRLRSLIWQMWIPGAHSWVRKSLGIAMEGEQTGTPATAYVSIYSLLISRRTFMGRGGPDTRHWFSGCSKSVCHPLSQRILYDYPSWGRQDTNLHSVVQSRYYRFFNWPRGPQ